MMKLNKVWPKSPSKIGDCYICVIRPYLTYSYFPIFLFRIRCPHTNSDALGPEIGTSAFRMSVYLACNTIPILAWIIMVRKFLYDSTSIDHFKLEISKFILVSWSVILTLSTLFLIKPIVKRINQIPKLIQKRKNFAIESILPLSRTKRFISSKLMVMIHLLFSSLLAGIECYSFEESLTYVDVLELVGTFLSAMNGAGYTTFTFATLVIYKIIMESFCEHVTTQFKMRRKEIVHIKFVKLPYLRFDDNICCMQKFYLAFTQCFSKALIGFSSIVFATFNLVALIAVAVNLQISMAIVVTSGGAIVNSREFVNLSICFGMVFANTIICWMGNKLSYATDDLKCYLHRYPTTSLNQHEFHMLEHLLIALTNFRTTVNAVDLFNLENHFILAVEAEILTFCLVALQYKIFKF